MIVGKGELFGTLCNLCTSLLIILLMSSVFPSSSVALHQSDPKVYSSITDAFQSKFHFAEVYTDSTLVEEDAVKDINGGKNLIDLKKELKYLSSKSSQYSKTRPGKLRKLYAVDSPAASEIDEKIRQWEW
jgi:hypothetical protein